MNKIVQVGAERRWWIIFQITIAVRFRHVKIKLTLNSNIWTGAFLRYFEINVYKDQWETMNKIEKRFKYTGCQKYPVKCVVQKHAWILNFQKPAFTINGIERRQTIVVSNIELKLKTVQAARKKRLFCGHFVTWRIIARVEYVTISIESVNILIFNL